MKSVFLLLLLALLSTPAGAQEKKPLVVRRISIKGNRTVGDAFIRTNLKTRPGGPFDPAVLNEDIKRLYRLGFFSSIEVVREPVPGGINLTFVLVENLIVGSLQFFGVNNLDLSELRESLRLKPKRPYSLYLAQLDRERILERYRSEGYPFASVELKTEEAPPTINVLFKVGEGPLVGIEEIRFLGNQGFKRGELLGQMRTEENGWFTTGKFDETLFSEDLVSLLAFYRTKGFLDAVVALGDVTYSADKSEMTLEIVIEEGPRYTVDKVVFEGNKLFSERELRSRMTLESGQPYDQEKLNKDRRTIEELYADNAHITAQIVPQRIYAPTGTRLSVVYQIRENRRIHVDRIEFEGNLETQDRVLRRQMLLYPGDPLSYRKVKKSRRRLLALNYFDSIEFDIRQTEEKDESLRDLVVRVKEGRTGVIRFAVGVTSNAGVVGEVSLTKRNFDITRLPRSWDDLINGRAFSGGGQFFTIQFQPGTELNRFRLAFREPHLADSPYSLDAELQAYLRTRETYDEQRIGGSLGSGRAFGEHLRAELSYRAEQIRITGVDDDAPRVVREVEGSNFLTSLILDGTYDRADDPLLPGKGYRVGASAELATEALGGDFDYVKLNLRGTYYYTPWKTVDLVRASHDQPHIVTVSGRLGLGFETGSEIPVFSRYFAGGQGSVRGFKFRTISPKEFDEPFGGDYLALLSIEYALPIYKDVLRMVFFTDFGSVTGDFGDLASELRASVGFGFRLKVPFLGPRPIALDFGFPLAKQSDDETEIFSFSIGRSF